MLGPFTCGRRLQFPTAAVTAAAEAAAAVAAGQDPAQQEQTLRPEDRGDRGPELRQDTLCVGQLHRDGVDPTPSPWPTRWTA